MPLLKGTVGCQETGPSAGPPFRPALGVTWPSLWAKGKTDFLPAGSQHCFSSSV
ncbi:unnamed protein product [Rangifer tarandus platyrhynchus]|uniref:Uncharacterized protein n=1 Tax=Rangifer tarandus platyrhynchus TaxID=3082113 RepID=A0AC59YGR9_RANTA